MPENTDQVNISDFNNNFDAIDDAFADLDTAVSDAVSSGARRFHFTSSDNNWPNIWAKLNKLASGETATFYMHYTSFNYLSGRDSSGTNSLMGVISRYSSTTFSIIGKFGTYSTLLITISASSTGMTSYNEQNLNSIIKSKYFTDASSTAVRTLYLPNSFRGIINGVGISPARMFMLNVMVSASGSVSYQEIAKGSAVSFETAANNEDTLHLNKLKITSSAAGTYTFFVQCNSNSGLASVDFKDWDAT